MTARSATLCNERRGRAEERKNVVSRFRLHVETLPQPGRADIP